MPSWEYSFTIGQLLLDLGIVSLLLLIGTLARRFIPLFQQYLIPNNLIAGFLGLLLGPELLGWLDFSLERMGVYVYHLLALTFISVGLRAGEKKQSRGALQFGFIQIIIFLTQALVGLSIALLTMYLLAPNLVPAVGMLLPLGFGMGPGVAFSIGQSWEAYGFEGAGSLGLTLSAIGFLVAYLSGIVIVNRGIRRGRSRLATDATLLDRSVRTGIIEKEKAQVGARLTFFGGAIEPLTVHVALVGAIYLATYWLTVGLSSLLVSGGLGGQVATLWSFQFILANLLALLVRQILNRVGASRVLDEGFLNRLTGLQADYLITASIMGISLGLTWQYLRPILLMSLVGGLVTYWTIRWLAARVFQDYPFERFVSIYGEMTGTISSGLALLRVTDPEYRSPVAQDLALGSGMALLIGFPLLLILNLPFKQFGGSATGYLITAGIMFGYFCFIFLVWHRFGFQWKKRNLM